MFREGKRACILPGRSKGSPFFDGASGGRRKQGGGASARLLEGGAVEGVTESRSRGGITWWIVEEFCSCKAASSGLFYWVIPKETGPDLDWSGR